MTSIKREHPNLARRRQRRELARQALRNGKRVLGSGDDDDESDEDGVEEGEGAAAAAGCDVLLRS